MSKQITPEKRREIAAQVDVHEQYLYQCLTGRRDMNPIEARRIETETHGEVTRQMLCQKTWQGIWPELATPPTPRAEPSGEHKASDVVDRKELVALIKAGVLKDERQHTRRAEDRGLRAKVGV